MVKLLAGASFAGRPPAAVGGGVSASQVESSIDYVTAAILLKER